MEGVDVIRELVFTREGQVELHSVEPSRLPPTEVRVRVHLTGVRHGLDLRKLAERRERQGLCNDWRPYAWGAGEVIEVGVHAQSLEVGDLVHGPMRHAETQTLDRNRLYPLRWMRKEFAVFTDPGMAALTRVHAAEVRFGDRVAIIGAGAVGLMALQYALLSGAQQVSAIDRWPNRLRAARRLGAEAIAMGDDSYLEAIREADVVIDLSGRCDLLEPCANALRKGARLAVGSGCAPNRAATVHRLCEEREARFIHTETFVKSERLKKTVIDSLASGRVIVWPIITQLIPIENAAEAYEAMQSSPDEWIKACFYYGQE